MTQNKLASLRQRISGFCIYFSMPITVFLFCILLIIAISLLHARPAEASLFSSLGPMIGAIETGSGLSAGVRFHKSLVQASAAISTAGYRQFEIQVGLNPPKRGLFLYPIHYEYDDVFDLPAVQGTEEGIPESGTILYFEYRYRVFTQQPYFGVGSNTLESDQSDFLQRDHSFELVTGYQLSPRLRFDIRTGYSTFKVGGGTDSDEPDINLLFNDLTAPGLAGQPDFFHIGPAILFDLRNTPGDPESGAAIGASFTYFHPDEGDFTFQRYLVDGRYFVPFKPASSVAAFWFHTSLDSTAEDRRVPFYLQESLGGSQTLRGFADYRFRDEKQIYVSAEYRWNVKSSLQLAAFYDRGKVFHDSSDFNFRDLRSSTGGGLRVKTSESVIFRLDFAHSVEENRIVFRFSPAF